MEVNTQRRAAGLRDKLPDIQKTLDVVRFLKIRKVRSVLPITTDSKSALLKCRRTTTAGLRPYRRNV